MTKRFQESQRDKLKAHFKEHIYYRVCKEVYEVFRQHNPSVIMTAEDLFADASRTLDIILISRDIDADKSKELWTTTFRLYRELDGIAVGEEVSQAEVAMLCYTVMLGLQAVGHSHYRGTLQRTLHNCVHQMWDKVENENCASVEAELKSSVNQYTTEMLTWMEQYFVSKDSLTKEIESVLKPKKQGKDKKDEKKEPVLYTLSYNCKDQKQRTRRIDFVRRKWEEWKWIESNTDVDDFSRFFDGTPRDCQLKWKSTGALLFLLLSELLKQNTLFDEQTGCHPRSIIINQFKLKIDTHTDRVHEPNLSRIEWSIKILNYEKPLELPKLPCHQGEDISDAALQDVFAGELHITKDINKYRD